MISKSIFVGIFFCFSLSTSSCESDGQIIRTVKKAEIATGKTTDSTFILKEIIDDLKNFLKGRNYNEDLAVFIDFKIPSSKYRFFLYDLKNDRIIEKGLVAHGSGSVISGSTDLKFSNIENSYQSSLGKYEIAGSYVGDFGKSYHLKGLEKTNDRALQRAIVLHPYSCIKDEEQTGLACLSLGCPMVSQNFFNSMAKYIDSSTKPIIMYCYY